MGYTQAIGIFFVFTGFTAASDSMSDSGGWGGNRGSQESEASSKDRWDVCSKKCLTDWCLAGNEGMDPIESLLGAHSLILYQAPVRYRCGPKSRWTLQADQRRALLCLILSYDMTECGLDERDSLNTGSQRVYSACFQYTRHSGLALGILKACYVGRESRQEACA